jgi:Tfp pilus assembly protein PilN
MIQFNLLPDVKLEYIRAQKARRLVMSSAFLISGSAVLLLVVLLSIGQLQKNHLNDLNENITKKSSELKGKPQIGKILTVQNQLQSLDKLHNDKPAVPRLASYLNDVTPTNVFINSVNVDTTTQVIVIEGASDALSSVNKYIDTLKFTTFSTETVKDKTHAFGNVVMSNFALSADAKDKAQMATFTITLNYDKTIFDATQNIALDVPAIITTRSQIPDSVDLFKAPTAPVATDASTTSSTTSATTTTTTGGQ